MNFIVNNDKSNPCNKLHTNMGINIFMAFLQIISSRQNSVASTYYIIYEHVFSKYV